MILSNETIAKSIGNIVPIDSASHDFGVVPGANMWSFNEGDEIVLSKENYTEAVAYQDAKGKRIVTPTEAQLKTARKVVYKFFKTEDGRLLSIGTLLRRNTLGKFHASSKGLPSAIGIADILDELDGKTVKVVAVDKFEVKARNQDGSLQFNDAKEQVMRDQKWYAFEVA